MVKKSGGHCCQCINIALADDQLSAKALQGGYGTEVPCLSWFQVLNPGWE